VRKEHLQSGSMGVLAMTRRSGIVTLFTVQPPPRRAPSSFVVSILVHGIAFSLLALGLRHTPRLEDRSTVQRYTVRLLNPPKPKPRAAESAASGHAYPGSQSNQQPAAPGGAPAARAYVPPEVTQLHPALQTLVQPDALPELQLQQVIPIPVVVMWSPKETAIDKIVPPPPQKPAMVDVRPAIIKPNREPDVADLRISSMPFLTKAPTLPPSTTSPIVVRRPEPVKVKQVPVTSSTTPQQPTPATVMSLSDLQSHGPVMIPLANQTAPSTASESLVLGRPEKSSGAGGSGSVSSKQNGVGAGESTNAGAQVAMATAGTGSSGQNKTGQSQGSAVGADSNTGSGLGSSNSIGESDLGDEPSVTRITHPKDGRFGVVVVGSSLADEYPETVEIWRGRLVYSVYLHVGLSKNWILQYSMPRTEAAAPTASVTSPDAPWPYDILRPNLLPSDFNSEAVMVHGFINLAGTFEQMAVVFPPDFTQAKFLLDALKQWRFRPARQAGQIAAVEVLLIIPEQTD
jgi:hypothetical protein